MIFYDSNTDTVIPVLDYNITERKTVSPLHYNTNSDRQLILKIGDSYVDYFKNWMSSHYDNETGMSSPASSYKRSVYVVTSKLEMFFAGTFIEDINYGENQCLSVKFRSDFSQISYDRFMFPEIKKIYRDNKIDQILSDSKILPS